MLFKKSKKGTFNNPVCLIVSLPCSQFVQILCFFLIFLYAQSIILNVGGFELCFLIAILFSCFERSVCKLVPGMKTRTRTKPVLAPLEPACIPFLLRICSLHKLAQQQKARFHPSKPSHNMQLSHHAVLFFCSHSLAFVKSFDNPCRSIVSQDVFCFS